VEGAGGAVRLKLDENLSSYLKPALSSLQHDVSTAADQKLLSQPDTAIAAAANGEGRTLLTLDLEFADLRKYPPGSHPGIILFRPRSFGPLAVNRFVEEFVRGTNLELFAGCVAVVEPARVRVRRPPPETDAGQPEEVLQ
jgi:predicted nuclease of predicted toxin-antitoxin system